MSPARLLILVLVTLVPMALILSVPKASEDLLALWLAARSLALGDPGTVYAATGETFTLQPPAGWAAMAIEMGHEGNLFPYIYPPLWAALLAPFTGPDGFDRLQALASLANPLLLAGCSLLAWRALRSRLSPVVFLVLGQLVFYGTTIGSVALLQNQPQILVAFLTLLAIERSRAGAQTAAGAALALAAAIKLYPLLYAVILVAAGQRRAVGSFVVVGAALGLGSIALAGWPLHREFLDIVRTISDTALHVRLSFSLDSVLAPILLPDALLPAEVTRISGTADSWLVAPKPPGWVFVGRIALFTALAVAVWRVRRSDTERLHAALWPVTLIALSLLGPLAWSYHFIAPAAFGPDLVARHGTARGGAMLAVVLAPVSVPLMLGLIHTVPALLNQQSVMGFVSMVLLALAFLVPAQAGPAAQNGRMTLPE